ncbi:MAG TPA: hypothetical protein VG204_18290 [Terriglobia bacterium]|nr:hypothetical protein [Terriglobia bacterium]
MVGLKAARVIVIDDEETDGHAIIKALWRLRIAALYFKDATDVPQNDERLKGVRLAFLDMNIVGGTPDKSKLATLVNLLKHILHPDNGPYSVVAWTRNTDLVSDFRKYLFQQDVPRPIGLITMTKSECKAENDSGFDIAKVTSALRDGLAAFSPLLFLRAWEGQCFDAASDVTSELSKLASTEDKDPEKWSSNWCSNLLQLIYQMALAEAGRKNLTEGLIALASFYSALNPLLADRLEANTGTASDSLGGTPSEILNPEAKKGCSPSAKARINTMLHCSFEQVERFYAGNVYDLRKEHIIPDLNQFVASFIHGDPSTTAWKENAKRILETAIPVSLEANPVCDHSQKKVQIARLIAGLLVPTVEIERDEKERVIKKAGFLWQFGPIALAGVAIKGEYYLVLNSLFVFAATLEIMKRLTPLARLRSQAFSDLLYWFGSHVSRPGLLMLRPQD